MSDFEVVRIIVAGQTVRKFFVNFRIVRRFAMAFLASWYLAMGWMAEGTGKGMVFGFTGLQLIVLRFVTSRAKLFWLGHRIGYHQRGVNRVTFQAVSGLQLEQRTMGLVTFAAVRDPAMHL